MRTLIVDQQQDHLETLEALLKSHSDVEVVGRVANFAAFRSELLNARPDLVFLDTRLPGGNGLQLIPQIQRMGTRVVLTSTLSEHAVEAFFWKVDDYLMKPISPERLAETLDRLREALQNTRLLNHHSLIVNEEGILRRVEVRLIRKLHSTGDRSVISTHNGKTILSREPLYKVVERLPEPHSIFQLNRKTAVDLNTIEEVRPLGNGRLAVQLEDNSVEICSKRRSPDLRRALFAMEKPA